MSSNVPRPACAPTASRLIRVRDGFSRTQQCFEDNLTGRQQAVDALRDSINQLIEHPGNLFVWRERPYRIRVDRMIAGEFIDEYNPLLYFGNLGLFIEQPVPRFALHNAILQSFIQG